MKTHNVLYVTIHGPDGVGKTTVGRSAARILVERGFPTIFFDDWRSEHDWHNPFSGQDISREVDKQSRAFVALQAAKVAVDSIVITELTDSGIAVIKDRGVLDVRADLQHRGFDPTQCASPLIREPDLAILLVVSEEARRRRLHTKNDVVPDDYQPNTPGYRLYDMTQSLYDQVQEMPGGRGMIIDTDDMPLDEVVARITDRIIGGQ